MTRIKEIIHLYAIGMSYRDIGSYFHISGQRVHQLLMNYKTGGFSKDKSLYEEKCKVKVCFEKAEHIHHLDRNSHNNVDSNLIPLCSPHHYIIHTLYY